MRSPEEFAAASFAYGHEPVDTVESQEKEEAMNERTPLSRVSELGAPSSVAADTAAAAWLIDVPLTSRRRELTSSDSWSSRSPRPHHIDTAATKWLQCSPGTA